MALCVMLVGTACGKSHKKAKTAAPGAAQTRTVNVDNQTDTFNAVFLAYFPDDVSVRPGAYHYYCNLHGADMSGTITVKAKGSAIPTQSDVDTAAKSQLDSVLTKLDPAYRDAKAGKSPLGAVNLAGYDTQDVENAGILE